MARTTALLLVASATGAHAQIEAGGDWADGSPVDTAGLGVGSFSDMEMLYERTIFGVDVLRLSLRFDADAADRIGQLIGDRRYDDRVGRAVIDAALDSQDVLVLSHFLRDLTLTQYLDGLGDNLEVARRGGFLTTSQRQEIIASAEQSYEPLRERGIRNGDRVWYRLQGNALHVAYQAVDGAVLLEDRIEGPHHRGAVLGSYLAPGSDFRDDLVRSLFEE
jgi:hypothetical protein